MTTAALPIPPVLKLIAHEQRWKVLAELAMSDRRVSELVALLARPTNLVSYHLRKLRQQDVVRERRSSADRRDVYYSLNLDHLRGLFLSAGEQLHPAVGEPAPRTAEANTERRARRPRRVLFLCTHNSARSQMAEGLLRQLGGPGFEVSSAGTEPSRVHPLAVEVMARRQIDLSGQRSKHMDELAERPFDYVITVCDSASETCPVFPGAPERIHWSIPDPAAVEGTEEERLAAFEAAAADLLVRIRYLITLVGRRDD